MGTKLMNWEDFQMSKSIRFELVAIDEDTEDVIAKATSNIDVQEVASEAENIQAQVDDYLRNEHDQEPDWDAEVKDAN